MVLVAAAGPAMNIALAVVAALLFHLVGYLPATLAPWVTENLKNGLIINVVLAVFNLFPIPPLDGGRILVGVLPKAMAAPVVRLEPFGIAILLGVLIVLPLLGAQLGVDLNIVSRVIRVFDRRDPGGDPPADWKRISGQATTCGNRTAASDRGLFVLNVADRTIRSLDQSRRTLEIRQARSQF